MKKMDRLRDFENQHENLHNFFEFMCISNRPQNLFSTKTKMFFK